MKLPRFPLTTDVFWIIISEFDKENIADDELMGVVEVKIEDILRCLAYIPNVTGTIKAI